MTYQTTCSADGKILVWDLSQTEPQLVKTMIDKYAPGKKETLEARYTSATETDQKHLEDFKKKTTFLKATEAPPKGD